MPPGLSGTLYTLEEHFLYVGPLLRSEPHAHHAGQIMWVPDGIALRTREGLKYEKSFVDNSQILIAHLRGKPECRDLMSELLVVSGNDADQGSGMPSRTSDGG